VSHGYALLIAQGRGYSLVLVGHVCHALGVQVLDEGFHSSAKADIEQVQNAKKSFTFRCML